MLVAIVDMDVHFSVLNAAGLLPGQLVPRDVNCPSHPALDLDDHESAECRSSNHYLLPAKP